MEVDAELRARYEGVMASIDAAAQNAGRSREDLTLIVVTKFHPASLVRELHSLGVRHIGENRHQDAEPKAREARRPASHVALRRAACSRTRLAP
ncbi:MAG: hypothetical protein ACJLS2_09380 [Microcella pacifica]